MTSPSVDPSILKVLEDISYRLEVIGKRPSEPLRFEGKKPNPSTPERTKALESQAQMSLRLKGLDATYFGTAILLKKYAPVVQNYLDVLRKKIKDHAQIIEL